MDGTTTYSAGYTLLYLYLCHHHYLIFFLIFFFCGGVYKYDLMLQNFDVKTERGEYL